MSGKLEGKVALITGGGGGIGRETARLFASEGAKIVVTDMVEETVEETARLVRQDGGEAAAAVCDVTKGADVAASIKFALDTFGQLNVLVNNAGIGRHTARIQDVTEEDWDITVAVNLKGVFLGLKYGIPAMQQNGGSIINIASVAGIVATPAMSPYGASKAGVIQLTKTAGIECAKYGIRVNCVCPAWTKTAMVDQLIEGARNPEQAAKNLLATVPLGRLGEVNDIARAILYLASDDSSFVNATALVVDGGLTAQ